MSATVTVLLNTVLACVKDAYPPLLRLMNLIAGHNWTTQGIADLALFFGLGAVAMKAGWTARVSPRRLILWVAATAVFAMFGLAAWYALF